MAAHVNEFIGGLINEVEIGIQNFRLKEGGWLIIEDLRYLKSRHESCKLNLGRYLVHLLT